ncbi:hypothetical protein NP493_453g01003 [Ridgeia piscesae]|uniref:Uncharacterized protein n=1 Tax=Ridgeia piscesae TaxID=27915 RepID=A0AAD9NTL3_RIDPI|nr:hypothetical protein NP493_453g01003 [Ridgeia piscesae]
MDVAQQRDIDIDRPSRSAQRWPPMSRWQNMRGLFDNESMTQLLDAYRMENLLDSDVSNTNSVLMMDPVVNNSWIGKSLIARTNVKPDRGLTSEEPSVMFARKQPSDDKQRFDLQRTHLLLYLQQQRPHT